MPIRIPNQLPAARTLKEEPATWGAMVPSFSRAMKASAACRPPFTPKLTTPQEPLGRYFWASWQ